MIHYFDSCALIKLARDEAESTALRNWVKQLDADDRIATSALAESELTRSLTRHGLEPYEVVEEVANVLDAVGVVKISEVVIQTAIAYRIRRLGTLDAIHLATAELFRSDLDSFVTYDEELAATANEQGLNVIAPSK